MGKFYYTCSDCELQWDSDDSVCYERCDGCDEDFCDDCSKDQFKYGCPKCNCECEGSPSHSKCKCACYGDYDFHLKHPYCNHKTWPDVLKCTSCQILVKQVCSCKCTKPVTSNDIDETVHANCACPCKGTVILHWYKVCRCVCKCPDCKCTCDCALEYDKLELNKYGDEPEGDYKLCKQCRSIKPKPSELEEYLIEKAGFDNKEDASSTYLETLVKPKTKEEIQLLKDRKRNFFASTSDKADHDNRSSKKSKVEAREQEEKIS